MVPGQVLEQVPDVVLNISPHLQQLEEINQNRS
jgi:hypothetical protein